MNIRTTTPGDLFPTFITTSAVLLNILVKGAQSFVNAARRRQPRGRRGGALERLRREHRTALPAILLSNVRSLANKMDELQLLLGKNRNLSASSVLCFTETWPCGSIPDSALQLTGLQLVRADRDMDRSGKTRGGGLCFYVNNAWCTNVTEMVKYKLCSPNLTLLLLCSETLTRETSHTNSPNTDSLLNARPGSIIFWTTVIPQ